MSYLESCHYSARLTEKLASLNTKDKLDFALINKAVSWAKKYHEGQFRQTGEPFYTHPIEVAYLVSDYKPKTDVVVSAILHDIVEDTEVTVEMIRAAFGPRIATIVDRLTRDRPDGTKLSTQEILNQAYKVQDQEVLLIKQFDRIHNLQTINIKSPEKVKKIVEETFKRFITLSIYLGESVTGMSKVEEDITELCYRNLDIPQLPEPGIELVFDDAFRLPILEF